MWKEISVGRVLIKFVLSDSSKSTKYSMKNGSTIITQSPLWLTEMIDSGINFSYGGNYQRDI